jgi:hypothetical protein
MAQILTETGFSAGLSIEKGKDTAKTKKEPQNCLNCVKREFCREICPEVEKILPKMNTGRMGGKLTIISPNLIESKLYKSKVFGRRKPPVIYDDVNWILKEYVEPFTE